MPNQHKTPAISWHPSDPALKSRVRAEADRQETTASRILDEAVTEFLDKRAPETTEPTGGNQ